MRHKLEVPWTSRLPVTRWWYRRHSPLATYTASSQGNLHQDAITQFRNSRFVSIGLEKK